MQRINNTKINNGRLMRTNSLIKKPEMRNVKRKKISLVKLILAIFLLLGILYSAYFLGLNAYNFIYKNIKSSISAAKSEKDKVISASDIKQVTEKDILASVARHINLPNENINIMVKVKDPQKLEAQSSFYNGVKKDDYVVVYPSLAIIYDAKSDTVLRSSPLK